MHTLHTVMLLFCYCYNETSDMLKILSCKLRELASQHKQLYCLMGKSQLPFCAKLRNVFDFIRFYYIRVYYSITLIVFTPITPAMICVSVQLHLK